MTTAFDGDIFRWCVADGATDDSAKFACALNAANAAGGALYIPLEADVYLASQVVRTGDVLIKGEGMISHTRLGGLLVQPDLRFVSDITDFLNLEYPAGWAGAETTQVTLASSSSGLKRGQIVLVSSDDAVPEQPSAKLGELARVQAVNGSTITLSGKLEFSYIVGAKLHVLPDTKVDISGITFHNPTYLTDDSSNTGSALTLEGVAYPRVTARFKDQANASLQFITCWEPYADTSIHNGRNYHTVGSYGYGVLFTSATAFGSVRVQGTNNRHLVSGGATVGDVVSKKGCPRHNTVFDSLAVAPLSSGFDTHESMYHTRFVNCWVHKQIGNVDYTSEVPLYPFVDRGAGTQIINCGSVGASGIGLYGASYNRQGHAGKYITRVLGYTMDGDIGNSGSPLRVVGNSNPTIASYHEVEITGCTMRRTNVKVGSGAPRTTFDGLTLIDEERGIEIDANTNVTFRNLSRRRVSDSLSCIYVAAGATLTIESYSAEGLSFDNNALIYGQNGTGTATVKLGQIHATNGGPSRIAPASVTGKVALAGELLNGPLRPVKKGTSGNRPAVDSFEQGQMYFDTTLGKPIWYNGSSWVDAVGAVV